MYELEGSAGVRDHSHNRKFIKIKESNIGLIFLILTINIKIEFGIDVVNPTCCENVDIV